ncbi:MAG: glutathione-disulfide reductase [Alphaproteobacteria bacterium]|nr:glutathione-disulfide reductase [Alphaproteobacteria bacterium]
MAFDFDLFTIGAGSGGVAGSRRAAAHGARVAIAEDRRVGGTCVLRGCVPKKLLIYGVHFAEELEDAKGYGWSVEGARLDWAKLIAAKNRETDRLNGIYVKLLRDSKVEVLDGRARIVAPNTVEVAGRRVTAAHILIATGGHPERLPIPGAELAIDSDQALDLAELPRRIAVIGGGYIAVEFAGIFRAAGAEVVQVIRADRVLRGFDEEVRAYLQGEMAKKGIRILGGSEPARIDRAGDGFTLTLKDGRRLDVDQVMMATGRRPNTRDLGLEAVGVTLNKAGAIAVDEWQATTVPAIHAIGDVTDRVNLTPVAIAEGRGLAETLFNGNPVRMDHGCIPTAVFSQPPVGAVGLTEAEAEQRGAIDVYRAVFRPMKHTLSGRDEKTLMKLVVDRASQKVVGAHMVGADAPEIVQTLAIAVKAGLTKRDFDRTVAIHPTAAEEFVLMREPVKRG